MDTFERSNLTSAQLAFWLGQKLNPTAPLFNSALALTIPVRIDPGHFISALRRLIQNCDVLRTVIHIENGVPQQRVLDSLDYAPQFLDLSGEPDPEAASKAWCSEMDDTFFDFERRLFETALIKLNDNRYVWYFNQHHIICDAFSFLIMVQYLSVLYDAAVAGTLEQVAPCPPFSDYLAHELANRGANADPQQRAYWEAKLKSEPEPISFYGQPSVRVIGPADRRHIDLGEARTAALRALAGQDTVAAKTPYAAQFNVFAAVLFAYLNRIAGMTRARIGMPFHNRRIEVFKRTPGIFMGVLPLDVEIEDTDSLRSLVSKVGAEASNNLRNSPYFIHNKLHTQAHDVLLNGLLWSFPMFGGALCEVSWQTTKCVLDPVVLNFYDNPRTGTLCLVVMFNRSILDEELQDLFIRNFSQVADAVLADPDALIGDLDLLVEDDKRRLLVDLNATDEPFPSNTTLQELVELQAARTPDAVALVFNDRSWTYDELNRKSNQLARHLMKLGVRAETLVGLCVERSPEMILGVLGILKAGGAYVPLDPRYPRDRIAFMVRDANVPVIVTMSRLKATFPDSSARIVCLDTEWAQIAAESDRNPSCDVQAVNLAYVIYTSGSTGSPKGAMLEHRGVCNLIAHRATIFELGPGARVLQFSSLSFDPSVCEIFMTLTTGGTLYLIPEDFTTSPRDLEALIQEARITIALMTPALLRTLSPEGMGTLQILEVGGEALPRELVQRWAPGRRMYNAYGPTETTVCSTFALCDTADPHHPSIGRPLPNTRVYILDSKRRLVPPGVTGELYIGGAGLARGYLGQPQLTAERFVPNPFSANPADRLYRTGDRVRLRQDGNLEFIGRLDRQVKVRGHRIELEEIESVLERYPDVAECVISAREDTPGDVKLVAYLVPKTPGQTFDGELKGFLRLLLPDYMLPSAYVVLDRLPLTANGKVDRDALPIPTVGVRTSHETTAPRDIVELKLQQIWQRVLDVPTVGVTDHFFDLGGHSLSAVHLMDQIQKHFDVRLSPAALFDAPTIETQAALIRRNAGPSESSIVVPLQPMGTRTPFFCIHPAPGTVFCYMALAQHMGKDRPFYGLQAPTIDGVGRVIDSVEETARRYIEAVREVQPKGPYLLGGHSSGGTIAFEMARQLRAQEDDVALVVLLDSMAPMPGPRSEALYRLIVDSVDETVWLASIVMLVEHFFRTELNVKYRELRALPLDAQCEKVLEALKRVNFVAPSADAGAIRGLVDNFRVTLNAVTQYSPDAYDGPVAFLKTSELFTVLPEGMLGPTTARFAMAALRHSLLTVRALPRLVQDILILLARSGTLRNLFSDPSLGWQRFTSQPIVIREVPGNHVSMLGGPEAAGVAAVMRECLDAADAARPASAASGNPSALIAVK